jgi:hypothetical protein
VRAAFVLPAPSRSLSRLPAGTALAQMSVRERPR